VPYLWCINRRQRLDILFDHVDGELGFPEKQLLHWLSVMCTARDRCLYALAKVVLDTIENNRRVIYGINIRSSQCQRILQFVRTTTTGSGNVR
jgi:hypothetical protein